MSDRVEEIRVELKRWKRTGCDRQTTVLRYQMATAAMTTLLSEIDRLRAYIAANHEHCPNCEYPFMPTEALLEALKGGGE